jgi:hypothetical protein
LNSLSGQTVGAIAASRYSASHSFVTTMLDGCPTYDQAGITDAEQGCGWARIIGRQTDQNATGDALGYRADAWTMQTGAQVRIAPNWFLGGSIAYESSDFRGDGGIAKVNGDSLLLGATLRYQSGPWQISGAVDFGHGWYDSRRTVQVGSLTQQANANPRAWQAGVHTRIAYQIPFEGWYLQPRLDLHVNHVRSGGYTENGADPFNLTVDEQSEPASPPPGAGSGWACTAERRHGAAALCQRRVQRVEQWRLDDDGALCRAGGQPWLPRQHTDAGHAGQVHRRRRAAERHQLGLQAAIQRRSRRRLCLARRDGPHRLPVLTKKGGAGDQADATSGPENIPKTVSPNHPPIIG